MRRQKKPTPAERGTVLEGVAENIRARNLWVVRDRIGTRVFLGVMCLGVICGPVACVSTAMQKPAAAALTAPVAAVDDQRVGREAAQGAAVRFIRQWLGAVRGEEDRLLAQLADTHTAVELPDKRPAAPRSVDAWTVEPAAQPNTWKVRVVVDDHLGYDVFVQTGAHPRETAIIMLPSQVSLEGTLRAGLTDLQSLAAAHPAAVTADGFVGALLAGHGDVSRWSAPTASFAAVAPAPCGEAIHTQTQAPDDVAATAPEGQRALVVVTVRCTPPDPSSGTPASAGARSLNYALEMTGRDGRWEVSATTVRPTRPSTSPPTDPALVRVDPTTTPR